MKFHVEPVSADVKVPPHPIEGPMPAEGGAHWIADQYTLRLIVDGVIRRVAEQAAEPAPQADASQAASQPESAGTAPQLPAAAPAEGTVASVPFMITAAMRKRLKALGKTDDEIANMKPEEAQAILSADPAPSAPASQEA